MNRRIRFAILILLLSFVLCLNIFAYANADRKAVVLYDMAVCSFEKARSERGSYAQMLKYCDDAIAHIQTIMAEYRLSEIATHFRLGTGNISGYSLTSISDLRAKIKKWAEAESDLLVCCDVLVETQLRGAMQWDNLLRVALGYIKRGETEKAIRIASRLKYDEVRQIESKISLKYILDGRIDDAIKIIDKYGENYNYYFLAELLPDPRIDDAAFQALFKRISRDYDGILVRACLKNKRFNRLAQIESILERDGSVLQLCREYIRYSGSWTSEIPTEDRMLLFDNALRLLKRFELSDKEVIELYCDIAKYYIECNCYNKFLEVINLHKEIAASEELYNRLSDLDVDEKNVDTVRSVLNFMQKVADEASSSIQLVRRKMSLAKSYASIDSKEKAIEIYDGILSQIDNEDMELSIRIKLEIADWLIENNEMTRARAIVDKIIAQAEPMQSDESVYHNEELLRILAKVGRYDVVHEYLSSREILYQRTNEALSLLIENGPSDIAKNVVDRIAKTCGDDTVCASTAKYYALSGDVENAIRLAERTEKKKEYVYSEIVHYLSERGYEGDMNEYLKRCDDLYSGRRAAIAYTSAPLVNQNYEESLRRIKAIDNTETRSKACAAYLLVLLNRGLIEQATEQVLAIEDPYKTLEALYDDLYDKTRVNNPTAVKLFIRKMLDLLPNRDDASDVYMLIVKWLFNMGDHNGLMELAGRREQKDGGWEIYCVVGQMYQKQGQVAIATECFDKAYESAKFEKRDYERLKAVETLAEVYPEGMLKHDIGAVLDKITQTLPDMFNEYISTTHIFTIVRRATSAYLAAGRYNDILRMAPRKFGDQMYIEILVLLHINYLDSYIPDEEGKAIIRNILHSYLPPEKFWQGPVLK